LAEDRLARLEQKVKIALQLRSQRPMSRQWIADRLRMGSANYVSKLLASIDSKSLTLSPNFYHGGKLIRRMFGFSRSISILFR
jgi:hypothetical protein